MKFSDEIRSWLDFVSIDEIADLLWPVTYVNADKA